MKLVRIGALAAAAAVVGAFVGVGLPEGAGGQPDQAARQIRVSGNGTAAGVPDQADFWFGVDTKGETAREAVGANGRDMRRLIAALKGAGIGDKDIQTAEISVSPVYSNSGSNVVGYSASNSVTVTVDVGEAGSVIDRAVAAGANQISGPTLTKSDSADLYRSALRSAVADARARAEALAAAAGVQIGAVVSIDEGSSPEPIPYRMAAVDAQSTPIEPGKQSIDATVTVTYAIA